MTSRTICELNHFSRRYFRPPPSSCLVVLAATAAAAVGDGEAVFFGKLAFTRSYAIPLPGARGSKRLRAATDIPREWWHAGDALSYLVASVASWAGLLSRIDTLLV